MATLPREHIVTTVTQTSSIKLEGLISDELLDTLTFVNYVILCGTISFSGVIFNIINVIVFIKQGFQDSINISLLFLAISDIGSLAFLVWMAILCNPLFMDRHPKWDFYDIVYQTVGWPHLSFTRITNLLTVFITLERFLCIAKPLKIKAMISHRKTIVVNSFIFIVMLSVGIIPGYIAIRLDYKNTLAGNTTIFGIVYNENGEDIQEVVVSFTTVTNLLAFICVIFFTAALIRVFDLKTKWRNSMSSAAKSDSISGRDKKLIKMVIFIAVIYIICNLPIVVLLIAMLSWKEFNINGRYKNLFILSGPFCFTFDAINSTANIFVYIYMSSKYKEAFLTLFKCKINKNKLI